MRKIHAEDGRNPASRPRRVHKSGKSKKASIKVKRAERRAAKQSGKSPSSASRGAAAEALAHLQLAEEEQTEEEGGDGAAAPPLSSSSSSSSVAELKSMLLARAEARFARNFVEADTIRDAVRATGLRIDWTRLDSLATKGESKEFDAEELYRIAFDPPALRAPHVGHTKKTKNTGKYKQRCREFDATGVCTYGDACRFAHTKEARRRAARRAEQLSEGGRAEAEGWVCFRCSRDGAEVAFARRQAHLPPLLRQCKECFHASCSSAAVVVAEGGVAAAEEEEEEDPRCWREVQIVAFVLELGLSQAQAEGVAAAAPNGCVFLALSGTKLKKIPVLDSSQFVGPEGAAIAADRRRLKAAIATPQRRTFELRKVCNLGNFRRSIVSPHRRQSLHHSLSGGRVCSRRSDNADV